MLYSVVHSMGLHKCVSVTDPSITATHSGNKQVSPRTAPGHLLRPGGSRGDWGLDKSKAQFLVKYANAVAKQTWINSPEEKSVTPGMRVWKGKREKFISVDGNGAGGGVAGSSDLSTCKTDT